MSLRTKCVDCNAWIEPDTIPAAPPPPTIDRNVDIIALVRQRLTEVNHKMAQYAALEAEQVKLKKMLEAVGE